MNRKSTTRWMLIASACLLAAAAFTMGPALWSRFRPAAATDEAAGVACCPTDAEVSPRSDRCAEEHGEGDAAGKGGRAHASDLDLSLDEIRARRCEHSARAYRCRSCRYEVGVVELSPDLLSAPARGGEALVRVEKVSRRAVDRALDIIGEIRTNEALTARISPLISGIVRSVSVDIGEVVAKGALLLEIESVELGGAAAACRRTRSLLALAARNLERERALFERKIASEPDLIEAQMQIERLQAELEAVEHQLRVLGLDEEEIAALGSGSDPAGAPVLRVRAPFAGTIIQKRVARGELAEPGSDALLLSDLRTLWAWGRVHGGDLATILDERRRGPLRAEVTAGELPGRTFHGTVDYVGATMDPATRTVQVRAAVENAGSLLRPGMFCRLRIGLPAREEMLAVPAEAVLQGGGDRFVFRRLEDDCYIRRRVETGRELSGWVEILGGLDPDEAVVTRGAFLLKSDVLREQMGAGCAD
ncbi:MAG: efflux RND transporter periplasmic adaptor subunit [Planctomycetes bacterium]|nr:efflux RND transporter periplasmic adaptor subunit [Planctomycetota bacterium]